MVAANADEPGRKPRKWSIVDPATEVHYTLPSGEEVIVSPHKKRGTRPLVTLPHGTKVRVVKVKKDGDNYRQA